MQWVHPQRGHPLPHKEREISIQTVVSTISIVENKEVFNVAEMMKGLILKDKNQVEMGERPIVEPGPFEVLVKTTAVSVCETDYEIIENLIMPPAIGRFVGHEGVGVVERVGEGVEYFKPGDRICIPPITPSWRSLEAQQGWPQFSRGGMAFDWCLDRDGVYGEYIRLRDADMNGAKIPDNVTDIQALMVTDMVSTSWHGVENTPLLLGSSVAVFGIGPIGLCAIAAASLKGAGRIFAIGTNPKGIELAQKWGATDIISYKDGDVIEQIIARNNGPVDISIIGGGPASIVAQAMSLTRGGGEICSLNAYYEDVIIPPAAWNSGMKTQNIRGWQCTGGRKLFERYLAMIALGKFDPTPLATHVFSGIERMEDSLWAKKEYDCLKPVCLLD